MILLGGAGAIPVPCPIHSAINRSGVKGFAGRRDSYVERTSAARKPDELHVLTQNN
jgi:hypothetical protein